MQEIPPHEKISHFFQNLYLAEPFLSDYELFDSNLLIKKVKPNFKNLGPRFGVQMKEIASIVENLTLEQIQNLETTSKIDLITLFNSIKNEFNNEKLTISSKDNIELKGRPIALKRSFENIIQNGLSYGNKVFVNVQKGINRAIITIEDDGPGIPEEQYKNVFKPFYKVDKSRGDSKSSVGLGLSITSDIIKSHGGNILLEKSPLNGLRVKIFLPL